MAFKVYDRVKETSSTAGSGTLTLAGAVNGFQAFSGVFSDTDTTHYVIVNGRNWEAGLGTYSSNTLSRDQVFESSNSNQLINITGASTIFVSYPASKTVLAQNGLTHSGVPYINASGHLNDNAGLVYDYTNQNLTIGGNVSANSGVVNVLDLNPISAPAYQEGLAYYDTDNKSITVYNDESEISLQVGQEEYIRIRNNSGSTIANGEAVRITGSQGTHTTVEKAIANDKTKSEAIGLATHDIENNSFGYITTFGLVRELNTNAFNEGDEVFLSAAASGSLTGVAPIAPNYEMSIGHVVRKHSSQGSILVTPGIRKLGGSDVKTLTTPDVKGVTFYTANSTSTAGILSSNPNFVYESGDKHLGLNQTSPDAALHASPSTTTEPAAIFEAVPAQTSNLTEWHDASGNAVAYVTPSGDAHFNNLMVTGVTTYVNTNTLTVQDKNIELASVSGSALGNDAIADGGGITLKSSDGDKTITWNDSSNSWNFNQNIDIDNGYSLSVNDYTLPTSDGSGNYIIKTDGSGTLDFVNIDTLVSAADPSGAVQFNDGGSFGGSSDFTWNGSSLQIGGSNPYLRIYETSQEAVFLGDTDSGNTIAALRLYDNNQVYTQLGTREGTGTDSFIGNTLRIGDNSNASAQLHITGTSTVRPTVLVEGAAAQSANLQEWQNSAGSGLAHVDSSGGIVCQDMTVSGNLTLAGGFATENTNNGIISNINEGAGDTYFYVTHANASTISKIGASNTTGSETISLYMYNAAPVGGLSILGQNVLEKAGGGHPLRFNPSYQDMDFVFYPDAGSANPILFMDSVEEKSVFGGSNSDLDGQLGVKILDAADAGVTIKGAASQSGNLQEWQNSSGTALAHVDAVGNIETSGYVSASGAIFRSNSDNTSIILGDWAGDREQSVIIGQSTIPQRARSVTIGWHAESRDNAVAIGWNAGQGGSNDSVHIGYNCYYGASNSVLIGSNLVAIESSQSVAIGKSANVTGGFNVGIGYLAEANIESVGIGANVIAPSGSVTIGYNVSGVADRVTIQPSSVLHAGPHLLDEATPASTTNTLYNSGGNLYFNGAAVGGSVTGVSSGIPFFDDSGNLTSSTNFTVDSGNGIIHSSGFFDYKDFSNIRSLAIGSGCPLTHRRQLLIGENLTATPPNGSVGEGQISLGFNNTVGKQSVVIGYNSTGGANGWGSIAIGYNVTAGSRYSIAIGNSAFVSSNEAIAIGASASAERYGTSLGYGATTNLVNSNSYGVAVGNLATSDGGGVAIGYNTHGYRYAVGIMTNGQTPRAQTFLCGNSTSLGNSSYSQAMHNVYFGAGYEHTADMNGYYVDFYGTHGNGTNIGGMAVRMRPGRGTGSARGGHFEIDLGLAGSSGTTINTYYNVFRADASDGSVYTLAATASTVPAVVQGVAAQSADLQQWQNNAGTVQASIDANGYIDTTGNISASGDISIGGHLSATTKSFLIDHPTKDGKLQYASLEGPENGVYVRGTTNEGEIILPDYWSALVHEDSITVSLTSVGEFQPLYVESKSVDKITVGGATGNYDYVVYAERKDVPKLEVEKWE